MPLFWRVFATNAIVLCAAAALLALSPATISFPVALGELGVLLAGLAAMLALNVVLLQRAFGPLARLRAFMGAVDPLAPGQRARVEATDPDVAELTRAFNEMIGRLELERRDSARRAAAAQEAERVRILRDLHDGVGQALTGVMLRLGQVAGQEPSGEVAAAAEEIRHTLEQVRRIARSVRPEALDDLGLTSALVALTTQIARHSSVAVSRELSAELPALSAEEEVVIYRVAQEALTNVVRHADATTARVVLDVHERELWLAIADDGRGFATERTEESAGIRGMRERALLVDGELVIDSQPGGGTTVRLAIPLEDSR